MPMNAFQTGLDLTRMSSVFSHGVWFTIATSLLAFSCLTTISQRLARARNQVPHCWSWFSQFTLHNTDARSGSLIANALKISTALFTLHSLMLYTGCLLSQLVKPGQPATAELRALKESLLVNPPIYREDGNRVVDGKPVLQTGNSAYRYWHTATGCDMVFVDAPLP